MGDNDFTAGDPWGLPIEDSEEIEIEHARDEADDTLTTSDLEDGAGEEAGLESSLGGEDESSDDHDEPVREPTGDGEEDSGWAPSAGAFTPLTVDDDGAVPDDADDDEVADDAWAPIADQASAFDDGDDAEAVQESSDSIEDDYEFTPPARTPLSQMIAAAQSVVSSVHGDQPGDADESTETEPSPDQPAEVDDEDVSEDARPGQDAEEAAGASLSATSDTSGGDDDLPDEPPAWMIVEPQADAPPPDLAVEAPDIESPADDEPAFTPMDIEASIADLATPEVPEVPFAEDQFEMPEEEEPEREDNFAAVDMDSTPGVYSELHDLADQDEQADAMLQEAAEAFGRVDEPAEDIGVQAFEPAEGLAEELTEDEDLDHYADALATDLETEEPTAELAEEPTEDEDLDHYADALATDLETEEPTAELAEEPTEDEDLDHYADALATDLETEEPTAELAEEPTEDEDLDHYADALATDLETEEPTAEIAEEPTEDEDLDHYADALATDLETEEPTAEIAEEPTEDEDLDRYADALATDLEAEEPTVESFESAPVDADSEDHLSDDELGAALAGLTEGSDEEPTAVVEDGGPVAVGWWETDPTDLEQAAVVGSTEELEETQFGSTSEVPEETPAVAAIEEPTEDAEAVGWWAAESESLVTASDDIADTPAVGDNGIDAFAVTGADGTDEVVEGEDERSNAVEPIAPEPAALIDSPVEWGTQYREAHQGWVEDEAGRSTWRPIVTSGESVAGWDIDIYLGLVSGDVSIDPISREEVASEMAGAREGAVRRMLDEGLARGAHAIVGVTFSIEEVGEVVLVGASGVAVTLRTPA